MKVSSALFVSLRWLILFCLKRRGNAFDVLKGRFAVRYLESFSGLFWHKTLRLFNFLLLVLKHAKDQIFFRIKEFVIIEIRFWGQDKISGQSKPQQ